VHTRVPTWCGYCCTERLTPRAAAESHARSHSAHEGAAVVWLRQPRRTQAKSGSGAAGRELLCARGRVARDCFRRHTEGGQRELRGLHRSLAVAVPVPCGLSDCAALESCVSPGMPLGGTQRVASGGPVGSPRSLAVAISAPCGLSDDAALESGSALGCPSALASPPPQKSRASFQTGVRRCQPCIALGAHYQLWSHPGAGPKPAASWCSGSESSPASASVCPGTRLPRGIQAKSGSGAVSQEPLCTRG
jgi:hypothetical protein